MMILQVVLLDLDGHPTTRQVRVGNFLGKGGFCEAFEVHLLEPERDVRSIASVPLPIKSDATCECNDGGQLVMKCLKGKFLPDRKVREMELLDLLEEAKFLARLPRHENIVALRGVSLGFFDHPSVLRPNRFLLLERVDETLDTSLEQIRNPQGLRYGVSNYQLRKRKKIILDTQRQRIRDYGLGVASALSFLHRHGFIYRDLKPSNIGVCSSLQQTGPITVKLLDFGLARPCDSLLSGMDGRDVSGTPRYMSAEAAAGQEHGRASDVHSFAMVLWEICSLRRPFDNAVTAKFIKELLVAQQTRPKLQKVQSPAIRELLSACWSPDPSHRPDFDRIYAILRDYTNE